MKADLRRPRYRSALCALIVACVVIPATATRAVQAAPSETRIPGTESPSLADSDRIGAPAPDVARTVAVTLPLQHPAELDQLIASASTPGSPGYGTYLKPSEFAERFGPTSEQVATVSGYLRSQGLSITSVSSNNLVVDARGRADDLGRAFGTTLSTYHDRRLARDYVANDRPVTLRSDIASQVLGVVGLNDHYTRHSHLSRSEAVPAVGAGPAGGYTPDQLKSAYSVTALATSGLTGAGQNIGLFELDGFSQSNITTFDNQYGLNSPAPVVRRVDGGSGSSQPGGGQTEVELDIEALQAIAPSASITVWEGPNTDQGIIDTYNAMVSAGTTPTNSTSWGLCEPNSLGSTMASEDAVFKQGAATGVSFFTATGDSGAYDCGDNSLSVDNPADDPYVTGAGGTTLRLTASDQYLSETAWSNPSNTHQGPRGGGGGGGLSSVFGRPSWQSGPGVANSYSNGMRQVPDVASNADVRTGYSIYSAGQWIVVGGTSAAAPVWAAFGALYNQNADRKGKARLGFANPLLYALAGEVTSPLPFHDIASGNNLYYPASAGWDYATGLGSYDATNLVNAQLHRDPTLLAGAIAPAGRSVSASATLNGGFSPTGSITFTLFGPADASCTGAPVFSSTKSVAGNGAYFSDSFSTPAAGTYRWVENYTGDANNSAAGPTACGAVAETTGSDSVLAAVIGSNSALFARQDAQQFQPLGGALIGAPAVVTVPNSSGAPAPLYVGVGTDHNLYVRNASNSWQPLTSSPFGCTDNPGAAITGSGPYTLTVACAGAADRALYYWQTPVTPSSLPTISAAPQPLGGAIIAGPAVAAVNGALAFFVIGTNRQVFSRTLSTGYSALNAACFGHPAVATTTISYFACQGLDGQLYYSRSGPSGFTDFRSAGGQLINGPGIALTGTGATVYVEGADQRLYHTVVSPDGSSSSPYALDGGLLLYGAASAALPG